MLLLKCVVRLEIFGLVLLSALIMPSRCTYAAIAELMDVAWLEVESDTKRARRKYRMYMAEILYIGM